MTIFDDLVAEQDRLAAVLDSLDEAQWLVPSAAAGWTVADLVLHLAQTEEAVAASVDGAALRVAAGNGHPEAAGESDGRTGLFPADVASGRVRALPYALALAGQQPCPVRCDLEAPDGVSTWTLGSKGAGTVIAGPAGDFCRVAARRLDPATSRLRTSGPDGDTILRHIRTYAA